MPSRGPRRTTDVDAVVEASIALADTDGLAALTMRRVAERVGIPAMSVYTYVPGKAELLDLMLDAAHARMDRTGTEGRPWRDRLTAVAQENRTLFADHPWAAAVSTLRPPLGPGQIGKYEHELAALDGCGLDDVETDACLTHLLSFVRASARDAIDAATAQRGSAMDDAQWWERAGPLLAGVLKPDAYPRATRIGSAAGAAHGSAHDPDHAYRFGLERLLDGLAQLIDTRR